MLKHPTRWQPFITYKVHKWLPKPSLAKRLLELRKTIEIPRTPDLDKSAKKTARKVESNNLYPDSLFAVRDGIPQLSDDEREARVLAIRQQQNAIKVAQENHILDREIEVSQGLAIETQIQTAKNFVTAERLNLQSVNLEIAQTQTDIASEKLENLSVALQIEQVRTGITRTQLEGENTIYRVSKEYSLIDSNFGISD